MQGSSPEEKSTMAQVAKTIVDNAFKSLSTKPRVQVPAVGRSISRGGDILIMFEQLVIIFELLIICCKVTFGRI